jgi:hypothetical protein
MCKIFRRIFYTSSDIPACLAMYEAILYIEKIYTEFSNVKFGNILQSIKLKFGLFVHIELLFLPYQVCKNSELTTMYILNDVLAFLALLYNTVTTNNTTFTALRIMNGLQGVMSEGTHLSSSTKHQARTSMCHLHRMSAPWTLE